MHLGIILFSSSVAKVTLAQLVVLKYNDKDGKKKIIYILREAACNWRDIACLIYPEYDTNRMKVLEERHKEQVECLRQTLLEGFVHKVPLNYTQDWKGLIELLDDVGLDALAKKIKHALTCPLL